MADVVHAAGGEIVEEDDAIAASEKALRQMGTDEAGAAGDQITQSASLKGLMVVTIARGAFGDGFRVFVFVAVVRGIYTLLRAVAVGIRIVPVRIVVVRSAGIHCIQNNTEDVALHAD